MLKVARDGLRGAFQYSKTAVYSLIAYSASNIKQFSIYLAEKLFRYLLDSMAFIVKSALFRLKNAIIYTMKYLKMKIFG